MNERPTFQIWKIIDPRSPVPFKLIEVMATSDGYRSRICDGAYSTREEAEEDRQSRIRGRG